MSAVDLVAVTIGLPILISALVLVAAVLLRRRSDARIARRLRELEETLLVYVLGGPAAPGPLTEREACSRSLHVAHFARALADAGIMPDAQEAEVLLNGARLRLEDRGSATRLEPPAGSPPGSRPPENLLVLTPRGAREALAVWARERAKLVERGIIVPEGETTHA